MARGSTIAFFARGRPLSKGSYRAVPIKGTGKARLVPGNSRALKRWTDEIVAAFTAGVLPLPSEDPVVIDITFLMPRPKRKPRPFMAVRPDLDKLCRAVLDALTGVAYADDAQVVELSARKRYAPAGAAAGAWVKITYPTDANTP